MTSSTANTRQQGPGRAERRNPGNDSNNSSDRRHGTDRRSADRADPMPRRDPEQQDRRHNS